MARNRITGRKSIETQMRLTLQTTRVLEENLDAVTPIVLNIGGARSSKSYSIAQILFLKMLKEKNKKILITRKTSPSLTVTTYKLFLDLLKEYGFYAEANHIRTYPRQYHYGSNWVLFQALDDPEKIKSSEFNYIWMEEANEFSYNDFIILKTRLSGQTVEGERNQIFLSLNPSDENSWIRGKLEGNADVTTIRSSYLDNPFLSDEYVRNLLSLQEQDDMYYKIYALGEWGKMENLIYSNYRIVSDFPKEFEETFYGLDFGYNNPTALIEVNVKDGELFERELLYETKLTNADLIERLKILVDRDIVIYADSEDPNRIAEIRQAGFNVIAAEKGKHSVKGGIDIVKRYKTYLHENSTNLIDEKRTYKWKKKGEETFDEPVKIKDHLLDAERYAVTMAMHERGQEIRFGILDRV